MKLLIDMNLTRRWGEVLTLAGFEALHWSTVGPGNAPDPIIMSYARLNDLVLLTQDLDFGAILAVTHGAKPSVVQIRADDTSPDVIGAQVISALKQMEPDIVEGALLTVEPTRIRIRCLPLRRLP